MTLGPDLEELLSCVQSAARGSHATENVCEWGATQNFKLTQEIMNEELFLIKTSHFESSQS